MWQEVLVVVVLAVAVGLAGRRIYLVLTNKKDACEGCPLAESCKKKGCENCGSDCPKC